MPVDERAQVVALKMSAEGCEVTLASGEPVRAARVVVATGAWSGALDWLPDGERLAYAIDLELGDQPRTPFLRGRYQRVSGH